MLKIVTYIVIALLVAVLGYAAFFYLYTFKPMEATYKRMTTNMPDLEKSKKELDKYKEQEKQKTAWLSPAIDSISAVLSDEIKAGKAEVLSSGNTVIVNISEEALYMPGSYTFSTESPNLRSKLATLLRDEKLKGKTVIVGNTTESVAARGKGRKKVPAKDARTLAEERSGFLVKDFEKNSVEKDMLVSAAYTSKQPAVGLKIKDHKTVLIIENPPVTPSMGTKQEAVPVAQTQSKPAPATKGSATAPAAPSAAQAQPKPIPIQPAQPKPH